MKNIFYPLGGLTAIVLVANIAYLQGKRFGIFFQQGEQVPDLAGGEVVEYFYIVTPLQQRFREVGTNESGTAGYQNIIHTFIYL